MPRTKHTVKKTTGAPSQHHYLPKNAASAQKHELVVKVHICCESSHRKLIQAPYRLHLFAWTVQDSVSRQIISNILSSFPILNWSKTPWLKISALTAASINQRRGVFTL